LQDQALGVLEVVEEFAAHRRRLDMVKVASAMGAANGDLLKGYFPEYYAPADPFADALDEDGNIDPDRVDETNLDWATPQGEDEDAEIARWIAQQEHSISVAEMDQIDN
jgi:hypothetical protein